MTATLAVDKNKNKKYEQGCVKNKSRQIYASGKKTKNKFSLHTFLTSSSSSASLSWRESLLARSSPASLVWHKQIVNTFGNMLNRN